MLFLNLKILFVLMLITLLCRDVNGTKFPHEVQLMKIESRIIGGTPIQIRNASYQVSVRNRIIEDFNGFGYGHYCGGSVVSQRLVITAAQCVWNLNKKPAVLRKPSELRLVMGNADLYHIDSNTLQYDVEKIISHPQFNAKTYDNDLAALFTNESIPWTWPTVSAIPLNRKRIVANIMCTVTGWGIDATRQNTPLLMAAAVPIMNNNVCVAAYKPREVFIDTICAGYMGGQLVNTCKGDGGDPLVCNGVLVGVASWGSGCSVPLLPSVYSNISHNYEWIRAVNSSFYKDSAIGICKDNGIAIFTSLFIMLICRLMQL